MVAVDERERERGEKRVMERILKLEEGKRSIREIERAREGEKEAFGKHEEEVLGLEKKKKTKEKKKEKMLLMKR